MPLMSFISENRYYGNHLPWFNQVSHEWTRIILGLLCFIVCLSPCGADEISSKEWETRFDEANRLYETGDYAGAIKAYEELIETREISVPLLYNTGHAHFMEKSKGKSLYYFLKAFYHSPRDPDVRRALRNLGQQNPDASDENLRSTPSWYHILSLKEWTWGLTLSSWLFFSLLSLPLIRPNYKVQVWFPLRIAALLGVFSLMGTGLSWKYWYADPPAVVIEELTEVRYGPLAESQSRFTLKDGAEVRILDSKNDWRQIRDAAGRLGWIENKDLFILP